jgi:chromosome segregation ATPase
LHTTEEEVAVKTSIMHDAERTLSDKEAELTRLISALEERSSLADAQKVEIVSLKTQVEELKEWLTEVGNDLKAVEDRRDAERVELKAATLELAEERDQVDNLGRRVAQLEQQLAAQTAQAELLGRRAEDLENRLGEQSRRLAQSEFELNQARGELLAARKNENDLRTDLAELLERTSVAAEKLKAEKAQLQSDLGRTIDERDRLARDLANMKREAEENWASEQVENALLRERVNDVAAEVARLASALEGPNSPIDAILAAETVRNRGKVGTDSRNGDSEFSEASSTNGDLVDRIRALQSHASRVPQSDKPTTRN